MTQQTAEEQDALAQWLPSVFREVLCNGVDHDNCLPCQHAFHYIWDDFDKSCSHRDITRAMKLCFPTLKRLQIGDEDKTRIFCGVGFHSGGAWKKSDAFDVSEKIFSCFEQWKKERNRPAKEKLKREMQQLVFYNPGPSTKDLLGFKPEFSNREKRKLNRLLEDRQSCGEKREKKPKKATLHDADGILKETGEDLCDCLISDCPGCHYPCPQCSSGKCGSTCRCNRKWTYETVYYDTK